MVGRRRSPDTAAAAIPQDCKFSIDAWLMQVLNVVEFCASIAVLVDGAILPSHSLLTTSIANPFLTSMEGVASW